MYGRVFVLVMIVFPCALLLALFGLPARGAQDVSELVLLYEEFDNLGGLPEGWTIRSGNTTTVRVSDEDAHSGKYSLRVEDASNSAAVGANSKRVPVTPGQEYVATAWAKTQSGAVQFHLQFYNAAGMQLSGKSDGKNSARDWTLLRVVDVAPEGATYAIAVVWGHIKNVGIAFYDDIKITEFVETTNLRTQTSVTLVPKANPYAGFTTSATDFQFTVKNTGHPRLQYSAEDIAALHARLQEMPALQYNLLLSTIKSTGDRQVAATSYSAGGMSFPLPPQMPKGENLPWQQLTMAIRTHLRNLIEAYVVTGDEKYAATAKRSLLAMSEWQAWHGRDNDTEEWGTEAFNTTYILEGVAEAYDMLYDYMTPEERAEVRTAIMDKALKPLYNYADNTLIDHNKYIIRIAAMGYGALALYGDEPDMDKYIQKAYERCMWYLDQRVVSDKNEGMNYLSVSMGHMMYFMDALERITGDRSFFDHPYLKDVLPKFALYFYGPAKSGFVNFADASLSNTYLISALQSLGRINNDETANWLVYDSKGTLGTLFAPSTLRPQIPADLPTSAAFPTIGWAALRSGWSARDTMLAFISSGSQMGHSHLDANHFVLNVGGAWLLQDPGYKSAAPGPLYEFSHGSLGHNTATVDGFTQVIKGGGKLAGTFFSAQLDYVAGDAAKAYGGTPLQGWLRHIYYVKPDYFILLDEMMIQRADQQVGLQFHNGGSVTVDDRRLESGFSDVVNRLTIQDNIWQLHIQPIWPQQMRATYDTAPGAETYGPFITLLPKTDNRRVNVVTLLDPARAGDAPLMPYDIALQDTHINFTVQVAERTDYHWLTFSTQKEPALNRKLYGDGINTDAMQALVSIQDNGRIQGYSMLAGRQLLFAGKDLISSPVEVSATVYKTDAGWVAELTAAAAGDVQLLIPAEGELTEKRLSISVHAGEQSLYLSSLR
ncbi:MAG: DUF4962 domain-containing protein [Limnochordia bacterium]